VPEARVEAAERGVGSRIDREKHALIAQMLVQRLAGDAGLDHAVEIVGMDFQHAVHVMEINADAAGGRIDVALERGAGAVGNHGHAMISADPYRVLDVRCPLCHHHGIRRLWLQPGGGVGVLVAHRLRGNQAVAEPRGKLFQRARQRLRRGSFQIVVGERGHGVSSEFWATVAKDI